MNVLLRSQINQYIYSVRYKHGIYNLETSDVFEFVVVGNSHARDSFLMNDNNLLNLGLSGQNLYWSNQMLLKFNEHIDSNAKILIEVSYFSLCTSDQDGHIRYVPLGFSRDEMDLSMEDYLIEKYIPIVGFNRIESLLTYNDGHFANSLHEFSSENELLVNTIDFLDNAVYKLHCDNESFNLNINILEEIILREKAVGREVILYSSPLYVNEFQIDKTNENVERFYSVISELTKKMDVRYFDHTYYRGISDNYILFRNANHLNNIGSEEYWVRFKSEVFNS